MLIKERGEDDISVNSLYNQTMKIKTNKRAIALTFLGLLLTALLLTCATVSGNYAGLGKAGDTVPLTSRALTGTQT